MSIKKLSYPILLIIAAMTLAACHDEDHDSHVSSAAAHSSQTLTPSQPASSSDNNVKSDNNVNTLSQKQKMEHPAQN